MHLVLVCNWTSVLLGVRQGQTKLLFDTCEMKGAEAPVGCTGMLARAVGAGWAQRGAEFGPFEAQPCLSGGVCVDQFLGQCSSILN